MSTYGDITPIVGAALRFSATITSIAGTPVNPDSLILTFRAQGQPAIAYQWLNPPGSDVTGTIINTATGSFYADVTLPNAATWTFQWNAQPLSGSDTTATSVIIESEILISASGV